MEKRLIILILLTFCIIGWKADVNDDNCVDQTDLDEVNSRLGSTGTNAYDVNGDKSINKEDTDIIQQYLDMASPTTTCDGYACYAEKCNIRDDDCDGLVDEDNGMCSDNYICKSGECIFVAPKCMDSDGNDIYTKGTVLGSTEESIPVNSEETCIIRDISGTLRDIQECFGNSCFVEEYTCNEQEDLVKEYIRCDYGCRFGKCRTVEKKCIEEDTGLDIFVNGKGKLGETDLTDICLDTDNDGTMDTLKEFECFEKFDTTTNLLEEWYEEYEIPCKCKEGVCTNVVKKQCTDTDFNDPYTKGFTTGVLSATGNLSDFDYCMIKTDGYEKTDRCSGADCYLNEYGCNERDTIEKYVHNCPLGCIEGQCIGKECDRGTFFVLNEPAVLSYNEKCELTQIPATDELDKPSDTFNNMKDFQCCSGIGEAFCVYDKTCYSSSRTNNFYEINGEIVVCGCRDPSCVLEDGDHDGLWYDLDSSEDICEGEGTRCNKKWYSETGFRWIPPGTSIEQEENVWEYESNDPECCGDDSGEYATCTGEACFCCNEEDMTIVNNKCTKKVQETVDDAPAEIDSVRVGDSPVTVPETKKNNNLLIIVPVLFLLVGVFVLLVFLKKTTP